ncbi:unnamed protein product [Miscanthus lutarioriparius]|uniref:Uncharacterized protein n=1 Tax=Miscanthus lutarioriparius TaxID=422564 RepID=A0A811RTW3_9POAL|nr:unnamed protein product [Miscanthus lutarioriparius]
MPVPARFVSLPAVGAVYFPQGHSEQVAASTNKEMESQIPNYPNLPPQLICQLHNVTMHADAETDEVYAQMTLQPLNPQELKDLYLPAELGSANKQPTNYFCKILTASDTSNISCGFSVPCRAARVTLVVGSLFPVEQLGKWFLHWSAKAASSNDRLECLCLGLTIWSEINYAVLHQAKELQGFASTAFASEHSAGSSSSRSNEQQGAQCSDQSSRCASKSAVFC